MDVSVIDGYDCNQQWVSWLLLFVMGVYGIRFERNGGMKITLLDGGMGQELCNRSANPIHAEWGGWVMRHEPHLVQELHEDYLRAGAKVITLNNYATTPRVSEDSHGQTRDFEGEQNAAIQLATAARTAVGSQARIAGSLPPLSWSYRPGLVEAFDHNLEDYRKIVAVGQDHVDLLICETMSTSEEARAAATAACESGKPVWVSWTLSESLTKDGLARLRSGESITEAISALSGLDIHGLLVNCSTPEVTTAAMPELARDGRAFGGYANAFSADLSQYGPGETVEVIENRTDLNPESYATHALQWVDAGATIVGGCCQTGPAHIAEIKRLLIETGHDV
jgi:S-methylmethionine-dependent homocysteine/selenocysteine methylase